MTRERTLGEARAALTQLPDLAATLKRTLTERHHDVSGWHHKVVGSPAPLSVPVVHLTDVRRKPRWHGEDPRIKNLPDRYGIAPMLETWVRVLAEELPEWPELTEHASVSSECAVLLEHWNFVTAQQWATELADDITTTTRQVRAMLGERPEYRPKCRKCQSTVIPVDGDRKLTSWEAAAYGACTGCEWTYPKGPALDALAQVQPPMTLAAISGLVGVPLVTLRRYEDQGLITATGRKGNARTFDLAKVTSAVVAVRGRTAHRGSDGKFTTATQDA